MTYTNTLQNMGSHCLEQAIYLFMPASELKSTLLDKAKAHSGRKALMASGCVVEMVVANAVAIGLDAMVDNELFILKAITVGWSAALARYVHNSAIHQENGPEHENLVGNYAIEALYLPIRAVKALKKYCNNYMHQARNPV
jgi:hypothetical protein